MSNQYKVRVLACVVFISAGCRHNISLNRPVAPPPPITFACSANPEFIFPGEPVTVTATAAGLDSKENAIYFWSGEGVAGKNTTAEVDTSKLAPGHYTITGKVKEGRPGEEGIQPWETATCTADFTVKAFEPPTISCSVNPSTILQGHTAAVTALAISPQNLPLMYSYSANVGSIAGDGPSAQYSASDETTGAVDIICQASDDKGHTAVAHAQLTVTPPPAMAANTANGLRYCTTRLTKAEFDRVNKADMACLNQLGDRLKTQIDSGIDSGLVIVGEETVGERFRGAMLAKQRALAAKDYLVSQGIDPSRIRVATGTTDSQTAESYLVPESASLAAAIPGSTPIDENQIAQRGPDRGPASTGVPSGVVQPLNKTDCNGFAVFGYPSIDLDDLDATNGVRQSFRLVAGDIDSKIGISKSDLAWQLCQGAGYKGNSGDCITENQWDKVTSACGSTLPLSESFPTYDHKTDYVYQVWQFKSALPPNLRASLTANGNCIQITSTNVTASSWAWTAVIKDSDHPQDCDTSLELSLTDQSSTVFLIQGKQGNIELAPHHGSKYERVMNWIHNSVSAHVDGWIFGGSSTGILVILLGFFAKKLGFQKTQENASSPQPTQPQRPINIFIAPAARDQDPEPHFGPNTPRRPRHRSRDDG